MKKNYLLILGVGVSVFSFGQKKIVEKMPAHEGLTVDVTSVKPKAQMLTKAAGDVLYSETFNGSISNWTTSGTDGALWLFDLDGPDGQFSSTTNADILTSTTAANGFMIFDADLSNPSSPYVNRQGSLVSPIIDMTGNLTANIKFQHAYRTCCSASFYPKLEVTTDGFATVTEFNITATGVGVNDFSGTVVKEVNISNYLATATNLQNFQFRFNFDGVSGSSSHYFWEMDDIQIIVPYDYSISANLDYIGSTGYWGARLPYSMIPRSQLAPIDFAMLVENKGGMTQTDIALTTNVPEGSFTNTGTGYTVIPGEIDTVFGSQSFTPANLNMVYNPAYMVNSMSNTDIDATDNDYTGTPITVNDSVYARDMDAIDGGTYNQGQGYEAGSIFDMYSDVKALSASIFVRSTTNPGAQIYARIYSIDPATGDFVFLSETDLHTVASGDLGQMITLPFADQPDLVDSAYLLVAGSYGDGGATDDFIVGTSGSSEPQTSFYFDMTDQTWYYTTSTPMVRFNLSRGLGLEENNLLSSVNVYPNPAVDKVNLDFNLSSESAIEVSITDLAGKVVYTNNLGNKTAGTHTLSLNTSELSNGVYVVSIRGDKGTSTQKLTIKK